MNVKGCRVTEVASPTTISVYVGGKHDEASTVVSHLDYAYRVASDTSEYFQVLLTARYGPLATSDYKILLEATPLDRERTFFHLSYGLLVWRGCAHCHGDVPSQCGTREGGIYDR